jgi:hypothetical protein
MKDPTDIKIGDTVFCADYDEFSRSNCYVNGKIVLSLTKDSIGRDRAITDSARDDGVRSRSHVCFLLRHADERNREPEEMDPIFEEYQP